MNACHDVCTGIGTRECCGKCAKVTGKKAQGFTGHTAIRENVKDGLLRYEGLVDKVYFK